MPAQVTVQLSDLSDRALLVIIAERIIAMSQVATDTGTAVAALDTKVDALIAAIQPGLQALQQQLAAAQAQIASLQAGDTADATALQGTIAAAQAETTKVQAAIDALTPPTTSVVASPSKI